ncbi:MAG: molecular chaperone HtpG [Syntrophobacteraceae bacterium]|nr:molecular chaperone HtpG [Syntrophobacteraceae bacterium]
MTGAVSAAKHEFKAEIKQLLDILVHSLYTNKEVFLRELVSNASDALEKARFESLRGSEAADADLPLEIRITFDRDKKLLVVSDTGIGMSREELMENIGTIAKSGSAEFLKKAGEDKGGLESLVGKFGVGFYSVFMAAREVVIRTRSIRPGEPAVEWRSDGLGTYEITDIDQEIKRGTQVVVHLKEDAEEFADNHRVTAIIKKHSNFISYPIFVEDERVNTIPAIWREPKSSVKKEQYEEFYKFLTFDSEAPMATLHVSVDAPVQFSSLLFIPRQASDLPGFGKDRYGLDLYVRRVLIERGKKELIPEYLGFACGVVDSEDLPLNVAREALQENALLHKMSSVLTRQLLSYLRKMATEEKERYLDFWNTHGRLFKLGYSDYANQEKYAELVRFNSSRFEDAKGLVSFDEYIERVRPEQKDIYYVFGPSREAVALNPHMEIFRAKGIEVLFLFDHLDEFAMESVRKYKDFEFKSVEHVDPASLEKFETLEAPKETEPLGEEDKAVFAAFLARIKDILGERVTEARVSGRLSESPCCLVNPNDGMTSSMQKILQIVSKDTSIPKKVFEVNQNHVLIRNLFAIYKANSADDFMGAAVEQLFESSLLLEGYLKDPHEMVSRMQDILNKSSGWYREVTKG